MEKLVRKINESGGLARSLSRRKNWPLKVLSFFFALFIWYFVAGEDKVDVNITVPVEIVNLPHNLTITNQFRKYLDVLVSGQRSLLRSLASQPVSRTVDLSRAQPGTIVVQNTLNSINLPRGIGVLRVQPENITFLLDRLIEKTLVVEPRLIGAPPHGYHVVDVEVEPQAIRLFGPEAVLTKEKAIPTEPIDIGGITDDLSRPAVLHMKPALADLIGEQIVTVTVIVSDQPLARSKKKQTAP